MKELMLGNKALARGLYEAGCSVVSSYPGTPGTEPEGICAGAPAGAERRPRSAERSVTGFWRVTHIMEILWKRHTGEDKELFRNHSSFNRIF